MENDAIVFAFLPDLATAGRIYARLLEGGIAPSDISLLTHGDFADNPPRSLPGLSPTRAGLTGHGPLLGRLDGSATVFELLSETLLGSTKKTGTIKAALIMGEALLAVQASSPAARDLARRTLDPSDGLAA